jgi:hypothetical protein
VVVARVGDAGCRGGRRRGCLKPGQKFCNEGGAANVRCEDTPCVQNYNPNFPQMYFCPSGATFEEWKTGPYEHAVPAAPGEAGQDGKPKVTGAFYCKTKRTCTAAGGPNSKGACERNLMVPEGDPGWLICAPTATNPQDAGPQDETQPDGKECKGGGVLPPT